MTSPDAPVELCLTCGHDGARHFPETPTVGDVPGTLATCSDCLDVAVNASRKNKPVSTPLFEKSRHPFVPEAAPVEEAEVPHESDIVEVRMEFDIKMVEDGRGLPHVVRLQPDGEGEPREVEAAREVIMGFDPEPDWALAVFAFERAIRADVEARRPPKPPKKRALKRAGDVLDAHDRWQQEHTGRGDLYFETVPDYVLEALGALENELASIEDAAFAAALDAESNQEGS